MTRSAERVASEFHSVCFSFFSFFFYHILNVGKWVSYRGYVYVSVYTCEAQTCCCLSKGKAQDMRRYDCEGFRRHMLGHSRHTHTHTYI